MGEVEGSRPEEQAEGLLSVRRPDGDPTRPSAPELDPHVPDRVEGERLKARPRPSSGPFAGEDQLPVRQKQGRTDPAHDDEDRLGRDVLRGRL
jgi:hypothetical protein